MPDTTKQPLKDFIVYGLFYDRKEEYVKGVCRRIQEFSGLKLRIEERKPDGNLIGGPK